MIVAVSSARPTPGGRRSAGADSTPASGRPVCGRSARADTAGAQGIEEHLVVAAQLDVLQTGAVAQGVVGEVEDVIRLVKGQVDLEQAQPVVDGVDEREL